MLSVKFLYEVLIVILKSGYIEPDWGWGVGGCLIMLNHAKIA